MNAFMYKNLNEAKKTLYSSLVLNMPECSIIFSKCTALKGE